MHSPVGTPTPDVSSPDFQKRGVRAAAVRVSIALLGAARGGYYRNGWYNYIDRRDIERLLEGALNETEMATYRLLRDRGLAS